VLVTTLAAAAAALALSGSPPVCGEASDERTGPDLDQNRRLLEEARNDPEHYERLQRDLQTFQNLPAERQERLRRLDRDLHRKDASGARLARVMQRYTNWLERLSPEKRQKIEQAADGRDRLRLIREFREQEWLPKQVWEELQKKPPRERAAEIRRLRHQEHERRADWIVTFRHWDDGVIHHRPLPTHLDSLPALQQFVTNYLRPLLSPEEEERLQAAEGQWPLLPRTLVELADKHPFVLPGPSRGPTRFEELPEENRQALGKLDQPAKERLRLAQGRWPDYAIAVTEVARQKGVALPTPLGPCHPKDLAPFLWQPQHAPFLRRLMSQLSVEEKKRLRRAEEDGWPDYPRTVAELAGKHRIPVPGEAIVLLPGPREYWDTYRLRPSPKVKALPEVSDDVLFDFALNELTAEERAAFRISFADPLWHERAKQAYDIKRRRP
jgi:hypothetical protein